MKQLRIDLEACAPLAIRADHAPGGAATAKVIAGTTLLGCLASAHRLLFPRNDSEFADFFLSDQIQYPFLYPAMFSGEDFEDVNLPVYPLPKTAQSCKKRPGFFAGKEDEERHGVRDGLLDWAMFELLKERDGLKALEVMRKHETCETCDALMDHFDGFYGQEEVKAQRRVASKAETRLQTRSGINREWGVVEESILYSREVIEENTHFWGIIRLPDALAESMQTFLKDASGAMGRGVLRIGTGRTRGLGRVHVQVNGEERHEFAAFKQRLHGFNQKVKTDAQSSGNGDLQPFYFALTLQTPLILQDALLRYRGTIDEKTLAESLSLQEGKRFTRVYQAADVKRVTGWQDLWGMPRVTEFAIDTGSVFLFSIEDEPDETLFQRLHSLEEKGMGQRRAEGFGRISVSDPFHWQGGVLY